MTETNSLVMTPEDVNGFAGIEVELDMMFWRHQKKRLAKLRKAVRANASFMDKPFKIFRDEHTAVNRAEILLLPAELAIFTKAIIQHPILLPTSFSQQLSLERGINIIRLTSCEPYEDFAARLSAALRVLG